MFQFEWDQLNFWIHPIVLPVIDYCDFVYIGTSAQNRETLQKLQNCAFRSIIRTDKLARIKDTHEILNMDMLDTRREKHAAIQICKFINDLGPEECRNLFTFVHDHHSVYTRSSAAVSLMVPRVNLTMSQRNIRYFGPKIWGKLSAETKGCQDLETFKKCIYNRN